MNGDNTWARAEEIFTEALERPAAMRQEFVHTRCGEDYPLRLEVLRLLAVQDQMGSFLETSMLDFRGQQFGAYRAMEEIGRGGMSVVYSGERVDGRFEKKVAIKVVLTQAGSAPETQILASLEHPNIARLLDGGTTSLGFRFLVMEFVEGVPCTEYAAARTERDRLKLFVQACEGVQAAHQALVVHRDLKPDNILVTTGGDVKLLDFGIAKMLAPTGAQTAGARAFTLNYASPEQILGQPASTANDVYSLGVLLCEWVGGRVPGESSELPIRGDLALIAQKAMQRDPAERYGSVGAMARDVERYLANEPVEARPPSWGYFVRKFAVRHRYAVTAAALAAITLAGTAAYARYQAHQAEVRFEQVRSLSRSVLFELHDSVEPLAGSATARRMIVDRSRKYLDALAADTGASEHVRLDIARGFLRLSEIEMQNSKAARAYATRAAEIAGQMLAVSPGSAPAKELLAKAKAQLDRR